MRIKDLINPVRWFAFVQANLIKILVPYHIVEQILYRSLVCRECLDKGSCVGPCGCKTPALFYSYFLSCSEGRWGPFMNRKNWNEYKQLLGIKFKL
jgi:hypothetical protein